MLFLPAPLLSSAESMEELYQEMEDQPGDHRKIIDLEREGDILFP